MAKDTGLGAMRVLSTRGFMDPWEADRKHGKGTLILPSGNEISEYWYHGEKLFELKDESIFHSREAIKVMCIHFLKPCTKSFLDCQFDRSLSDVPLCRDFLVTYDKEGIGGLERIKRLYCIAQCDYLFYYHNNGNSLDASSGYAFTDKGIHVRCPNEKTTFCSWKQFAKGALRIRGHAARIMDTMYSGALAIGFNTFGTKRHTAEFFVYMHQIMQE